MTTDTMMTTTITGMETATMMATEFIKTLTEITTTSRMVREII